MALSTIGTTALSNDSVTADKVADNAITTDMISSGQVGVTDLADGSITNAKLSNSAAVASSKLDLSGVAQAITVTGHAVTAINNSGNAQFVVKRGNSNTTGNYGNVSFQSSAGYYVGAIHAVGVDNTNNKGELHFRTHDGSANQTDPYSLTTLALKLGHDGAATFAAGVTATSLNVTSGLASGTGIGASGASGNLRLYANGTQAVTVATTGAVGIGIPSGDGTLHVHTATAGTVTASTQADDIVIENGAEGGMTIITPDDQSARIRFTSPSTNTDVGGATIFYRQNINKMLVGTAVSGGVLALASGAGNESLVLASSGAATFSSTVNGMTIKASASGDRWGCIAEVASNGVMEVGRYIDFHATDGDTSDYGARLDFDGTNLITAANSSVTGTLNVAGVVDFATSQGAGYAGTKIAGLEVGTIASGGSLLVRTPSLNSSFSSGLFVDGAYSSGISQVNLTAAGVHSGGGYEGNLHLRTTSQVSIFPAITAKPTSLQFYTSNLEQMSISSTGEVSRTTATNALDDSITTLRFVNPGSDQTRASCQCDVMYSTQHLGHNTTLWLSVLTPQATANWDAGGSATFKLTWSGFHASGTSMAKWDCVFGNNHAGNAFRWARSAVSMLEATDSYYGYTPGVEFYRQTGDGNGFTGGATTMRVLWIKITGNASSNVCPTRTLEISGVVGGPTFKYVVAHGGYSTPTNVSAIGASV